jgi:plasmid maintenance system antidote protein VapI
MTGRERLIDWMRISKLNQRQAAKVIGLHWGMVNKLVLGIRRPGRQTAVKIQRATGIAVDAWEDTPRRVSGAASSETVGNVA